VFRVAIIGGGVAGATAALYLGRLGVHVTLFEKNATLISGPPFCHLHAGGNLYPQISDAERLTLLRQSIDLARYYPFAIDYRPTVIATPLRDATDPGYLVERLGILDAHYRRLVAKDPANRVLGDTYYRLYTQSDLARLKNAPLPQSPRSFDEWMAPVARYVVRKKLKEPLAIVNEWGLNIFSLSGALNHILRRLPNVDLRLKTRVVDIAPGFTLTSEGPEGRKKERFDFLVNAAGFATGAIDAMLGFRRKRFVEFKAAYLAHWPQKPANFCEIIFHGARGSDAGMGQFTPYGGDLFQLHGMSKKITLFDDGLVAGDPQPRLNERFLELIEKDWGDAPYEERTKRAIEHIAEFIPAFSAARPAAKPLFGAQQIPGEDPELRAADVSFEGDRYARCEIVKASSVLDMSEAIAKRLADLGVIAPEAATRRDYSHIPLADPAAAREVAASRGYPTALATPLYPK